jgi:hypothetical protein
MDRCACRPGVVGGAEWDGISGDGTIVPMALNYTQQKALAMQWKAAAPALRKARHAVRLTFNSSRIEGGSNIGSA